MEGELGQPLNALLKYEKLILTKEETTSGHGCGFFPADFSSPAPHCHRDRLAQGFFLSSERS